MRCTEIVEQEIDICEELISTSTGGDLDHNILLEQIKGQLQAFKRILPYVKEEEYRRTKHLIKMAKQASLEVVITRRQLPEVEEKSRHVVCLSLIDLRKIISDIESL